MLIFSVGAGRETPRWSGGGIKPVRDVENPGESRKASSDCACHLCILANHNGALQPPIRLASSMPRFSLIWLLNSIPQHLLCGRARHMPRCVNQARNYGVSVTSRLQQPYIRCRQITPAFSYLPKWTFSWSLRTEHHHTYNYTLKII